MRNINPTAESVQSVNIAIAEDKALFRENLVLSLKDYRINTIIKAENGEELLEALKLRTPDVILLDLRMPKLDGSDTYNHLKSLYPEMKVIILSTFNEKVLIDDLVNRGVWGYVTKDEISGEPERLAKFIRKVHGGTRHITLYKENQTLKFSETQKDIVQMEGRGLRKKEISDVTGLTENAIRKQIRKIMEKFGVSTLAAFYTRIANSGFEFLRLPSKRTPKK